MIMPSAPDHFITRARVRLTATLVLAATIIGLCTLFATAHGTGASLVRPLETEF